MCNQRTEDLEDVFACLKEEIRCKDECYTHRIKKLKRKLKREQKTRAEQNSKVLKDLNLNSFKRV